MNESVTRRARLPVLLSICLLVLAPGLYAENYAGTDWDQVSLAHQQLLQQYRDDMTPEQRERAQQSLKRWKALSPEQQQRILQRIQAFRELPLELRQSLRAKYQWFNLETAVDRYIVAVTT